MTEEPLAFMGYQEHFRISIRVATQFALEALGFDTLLPQVFLVAVPAPGHEGPIRVCPSNESLQPEHLASVIGRAGELYEAHPLRSMQHSHRGVHEARQDGLRRRSVSDAVGEAINTAGLVQGKVATMVAVSRGLVEIVVCVVLPQEVVDAVEMLSDHAWGTYETANSLLGALLRELDRSVGRDLQLPEPGPPDLSREGEELVERASREFLRDCLYRADSYMEFGKSTIDAIAASTYETGTASGRLVVARSDHPALRPATEFVQPVPAKHVRRVRKLLETTDERMALLVRDGVIWGIGEVGGEEPESLVEIEILAGATWELRIDGRSLMTVRHGDAKVSRASFDRPAFDETARRTIGDSADLDALAVILDTAAALGHGSTLVISRDAAEEAERLGEQAVRVVPQALTPDLFSSLSTIDGAFLADEHANLHAFGVILDGEADPERGDPARGSRFNSAERYVHTRGAGTMAAVTSDDGGLVILPRLEPRVSRQAVEDAVRRVEGLAGDPQRRGQFADAMDRLRLLAFYISEDQAERANAAIMEDAESRRAEGAIVPLLEEFEVAPAPPDDYFFP